MSAVIMDDFDQDLDIQFIPDEVPSNANVAETTRKYRPKRGQGYTAYLNPYKMNPFEVRKADFREARLYDDEISEPGWSVQAYFANKKYRRWLYKTRQQPGMKGLRRTFVAHYDESDENDANGANEAQSIPIISKPQTSQTYFQPYSRPSSRNHNQRLLPQSRVKGAKPGDDDFKAKMFTSKMGTIIGALRQQKNITQVDLALKLNVDAAMIRNIEKGGLITFNSEDVMVKEMAKVLGVPSIKYIE